MYVIHVQYEINEINATNKLNALRRKYARQELFEMDEKSVIYVKDVICVIHLIQQKHEIDGRQQIYVKYAVNNRKYKINKATVRLKRKTEIYRAICGKEQRFPAVRTTFDSFALWRQDIPISRR